MGRSRGPRWKNGCTTSLLHSVVLWIERLTRSPNTTLMLVTMCLVGEGNNFSDVKKLYISMMLIIFFNDDFLGRYLTVKGRRAIMLKMQMQYIPHNGRMTRTAAASRKTRGRWDMCHRLTSPGTIPCKGEAKREAHNILILLYICLFQRLV